MPSNLLKSINLGEHINNDPACSPLTREAMAEALKIAADDDLRAGRAVALIPKVRVEVYPHALSPSRDKSPMEGNLPLVQRFKSKFEQEPFDLTPYLSTVQVSKATAPGSVGSCSVRLKRNVNKADSVAADEALHPVNNPDKDSNEWLQLIEDNDIMVVHLEVGVANTAQELSALADGLSVESMEFHVDQVENDTVSDLGATTNARYSVASVGRAKAPMVFFGFIDSVRRVRAANGLGGATYEYDISASDFSKCMSSRVPAFIQEEEGTDLLFQRAGIKSFESLSIDIVCAYLLRGLLQARSFSTGDLSTIENTLKRAARTEAVSGDASSAPLSAESLKEIDQETDQLVRLNKLLFELVGSSVQADRDILEQLGDKATPTKFLLPQALTNRFRAFDRQRVGGLAPVASLLGGSTGAQLGELMTIHTGYSGNLITQGDKIAVNYNDLTKSAQSPLSGSYGIPSYLTTTVDTLLQNLAADTQNGLNLNDVLQGIIGDTMGAVEYRYDLCDYHGASTSENDLAPVTMPTLFIHSRTRPLNAISPFEIDAHLTGHSEEEKTPKSLWAQEHQLSLLEWASIPINLISETDIVTESLQRDGSGRATLLHSSLNANVNLMASINAAKKPGGEFGKSVGTPLFYSKPLELVHGYLPRDYQSKGVTDQTAIAGGLTTSAATNVVFTKHRDDVLAQPIELKGTIVVACLLPSARAGQRLAIFRPDRQVGSLDEFRSRWEQQHIYGLHPDFLDATLADPSSKEAIEKMEKSIADIIKSNKNFRSSDILTEINNRVGSALLEVDGAMYRSWFFAHFDSFLIEEVTHGVEINPQDGTIQATTALVVSYGAMGRETPAVLSTLPALSDLVYHFDSNEARAQSQERLKVKLASRPQQRLVPDDAPSEDEVLALTASLNRAGYFDSFVDRWRANGQQAALFRDVEVKLKELTLIQRFLADMSSFYNFSPDKGDTSLGGQKTALIRVLDNLMARDPLKKPTKIAFPAFLRKAPFYAQLTNPAGPIESQARNVTKIDYWKDGEREVNLPQGRYAVPILQTEVRRIVALMEADLSEALIRYRALKVELAEAMSR